MVRKLLMIVVKLRELCVGGYVSGCVCGYGVVVVDIYVGVWVRGCVGVWVCV